ncbi:MAG: phosphoribosylaminoimidazolesuccinocarboxamide synthase [Bdellovibrio sp.]
MKPVYLGSVKDLYQTADEKLIFLFSDRYSVFDWGEMPDHLVGKGVALTRIAHLFFDQFRKAEFWQNLSFHPSTLLEEFRLNGAKHHYYFPVLENGEEGNYKDNIRGLKVEPVQVLRPPYNEAKNEYDYSQYIKKPQNCLVPLEMIFRFGLTPGSSIFDRLDNQHYLSELGYSKEQLTTSAHFSSPLLEFSTKLESRDRYLTYSEAKVISGCDDSEWVRMNETIELFATGIQYIFSNIGITLVDGKIEMAFYQKNSERHFMLVDSIGPDELRLHFEGHELSKECLRTFYRKDPWFAATKEAKNIADQQGRRDWKTICREIYPPGPQHLPQELKTAIEMLYRTIARELYLKYYATDIDPSAWDLKKLTKQLKGMM